MMRISHALPSALVAAFAACGDTSAGPADADADAAADATTSADSLTTADSAAADSVMADGASDGDGAADAQPAALPSIDKALSFSPDERGDIVLVQPAVAWGGDGRLMLAWTGADGDQLGIFAGLWRVDGDGAHALVAPQLANVDRAGLRNVPSLCALDGDAGFVLAWSLDRQDGSDDNLGIDWRRFDGDGAALDAADRHLVTERAGGHWLADVACRPGGGYAIAGVRSGTGDAGFEVFVAPFGDDGEADGAPLVPLVRDVGGQAFPAVAAGAARSLWVAWEDTPALDQKTVIALRRLTPSAADVRQAIVSTASDASAALVAVDPLSDHALVGGVVGTKLRLALDIGAADLVAVPLPEAASATTTSAAAAALGDDGFAVVWLRGTGASVDVRYAEVRAGAFGPVTTLGSGSIPLAYRPALDVRDGRVAVAWTESQGGGHYLVRTALFAR